MCLSNTLCRKLIYEPRGAIRVAGFQGTTNYTTNSGLGFPRYATGLTVLPAVPARILAVP